MTKKLLWIAVIFVIAVLFRGYDFGNTPAGISDDEASHGYNAYSLLLTGKDEYGKIFPILNRSFGTYASSLYTYMTIPSVKLFGLTATSTRLVSLASGLILVILLALVLGPAAGLVAAVSPVFVFYSRGAFEANLALTLLILGLILAKRSSLSLSFLIISLSAYAYPIEKILAPIILLYLSYIFWASHKKQVLISLLLSLVILIPLISVTLTPGANSRASTLVGRGNFPQLLLSYFSPNNLFSRPDPAPRKSFPDLGAFYWWMAIPFAFGAKKIIHKRLYTSYYPKLLILIAIASVIVAATTGDYFSTWRALPMFILVAWIISHGLTSQKKIVYIFLVLVAAFELYSNLVLVKHLESVSWGYHYKELAGFVKDNSHRPIVIDNARSSPIYIWLAYYNQLDPKIFQKNYDSTWLKNYYNHTQFNLDATLDNVEIRPIFWEKDLQKSQLLISDSLGISSAQAAEHSLTLQKTIPDINGHPVLFVYETTTSPMLR